VNPRTRHALFLYDIAANAFHKVGDAVLDSSSGAPERMFETWPLAPDGAMVLWHSGEIRVKAEVYVRERDHLLLFSPRHPQGLEVLTLGLDDGNVERWAMVDHTLWLETVDARNIDKPAAFVWSLDLSKALQPDRSADEFNARRYSAKVTGRPEQELSDVMPARSSGSK
jgi:hypothetical protein